MRPHEEPKQEEPKPFGRYDEWIRLFAAFVLTGIIGAIISMHLQERSWRHQRTLGLCDDDKKSATEVASKISDLMDRRLWSLRRFVDRLAQTGKLADAAIERKAYGEAVAEWNVSLNRNRILVRRYFGQNLSDAFMDDVHNKGFGRLHKSLNDILFLPKLDVKKVTEEKDAIDAFNPTVDFFDDQLLERIQKDATTGCTSQLTLR
jgi:hypothetical protein